jgi:ribosomal-protein-alanine N-acetyltransferase
MRLRPFTPDDAPAVSAITREALRENYPISLFLDIHRWWREGFQVAEIDGRIVGFLAAVLSGPSRARILMLAVARPHRRRRIGTALMDAFLKLCAARNVRTIELETRRSNAEAIRFYARYGFQIVHTIRAFYTDGEDAYKMVRRG